MELATSRICAGSRLRRRRCLSFKSSTRMLTSSRGGSRSLRPEPAAACAAARRREALRLSRFLVLISVLNRLAEAAGVWALFFRSFVMGWASCDAQSFTGTRRGQSCRRSKPRAVLLRRMRRMRLRPRVVPHAAATTWTAFGRREICNRDSAPSFMGRPCVAMASASPNLRRGGGRGTRRWRPARRCGPQ